MTLGGLVTFWALMITAYSVLPEYWKFRLKAFVPFVPALMAFLISSILVIVSMCIDEKAAWTITTDWEIAWQLILQIIAYIVLFLFALFMYLRLSRSHVDNRNLPLFRRLLSSLAMNKQFDLVAEALKDNVQKLAQIYNLRDTRSLQPISDAKLMKYQEEVSEIFRQITSNEELTKNLAKYDIGVPLLIANISEGIMSRFDLEDYVHSLLDILIRTPGSQLYKELQQVEQTGQYGAEAKLLPFLFDDANVAKKRETWKPIGHYIWRYIHERPGDMNDEYNKEANFFTDTQDVERYSDPIFIGIVYFDYMIKEAIRQQITDHMWLYYFRYWVKEIVTKLKYDAAEWKKGNREYPTRYTFYLSKIVHRNLGWFEFALDEQQATLDKDNIILTSAAKCIANSLRPICESQELSMPECFIYKQPLTELWWKTYFKLKLYNNGRFGKLADLFLNAMHSEIKGDMDKGAFANDISLPLLGRICSSLFTMDRAWLLDNQTASKIYKDSLQETKQLTLDCIKDRLSNIRTEDERQKVINLLGSEYMLSSNVLCFKYPRDSTVIEIGHVS